MFGKGKPQSKRSQLIFLAIFLLAVAGAKLWQYHWSEAVVELRGETLEVLIAKNRYQQRRGLGRRDELSPYDGMIFLFPFSKQRGFVMREMRFPIDIIWLNHGLVVDFAPKVPIQPNTPEDQLTVYYPRKSANMVLEVPAGWALEYDLKIGDRLSVIEE